jgi:hypothetical protein
MLSVSCYEMSKHVLIYAVYAILIAFLDVIL